MRILHRYILSNFLVTFAISMAVLTFVMMVGLVFGSMKYIARGMDAMLVVRFLVQNLPGTLSYSVPVSALVSSLLVFSRLSSDSEISAMRSCGVSLASIMRTPVLFAVLLALACLYVNDNVSPEAAYSRSLRRKAFRATDVMALLEPRTWVPFGKYDLFVARRDGETLQDLRVNEALPGGRTREIRAATARVGTNGAGRAVLMMSDVTIDPWRENAPGMSHADVWQLPLSALSGREDAAPGVGEGREPARRAKDTPTWALARDVAVARRHPPVRPEERVQLAALEARLAEMRAELARSASAEPAGPPDATAPAEAAGPPDGSAPAEGTGAAEEAPPAEEIPLAARVEAAAKRLKRIKADFAPRIRAERELSRAKVEIGVRATLAAACICFVLVGIPLGMQSHRRQSSVGIGISLGIAGAFYVFCIAAESLSKHPELRAHWLLPVPVLVCAVLGAVLIRRRD